MVLFHFCFSEDDGVGMGAGPPGQLNPSTKSFKIVTEIPLVVMFLFQLYTKLVQTNIPFLLPLMVTAISLPGPDKEKLPPHLKQHFLELKGAQVKVKYTYFIWVVFSFSLHYPICAVLFCQCDCKVNGLRR